MQGLFLSLLSSLASKLMDASENLSCRTVDPTTSSLPLGFLVCYFQGIENFVHWISLSHLGKLMELSGTEKLLCGIGALHLFDFFVLVNPP